MVILFYCQFSLHQIETRQIQYYKSSKNMQKHKNYIKNEFDQCLECAAPKCCSNYTTFISCWKSAFWSFYNLFKKEEVKILISPFSKDGVYQFVWLCVWLDLTNMWGCPCQQLSPHALGKPLEPVSHQDCLPPTNPHMGCLPFWETPPHTTGPNRLLIATFS